MGGVCCYTQMCVVVWQCPAMPCNGSKPFKADLVISCAQHSPLELTSRSFNCEPSGMSGKAPDRMFPARDTCSRLGLVVKRQPGRVPVSRLSRNHSTCASNACVHAVVSSIVYVASNARQVLSVLGNSQYGTNSPKDLLKCAVSSLAVPAKCSNKQGAP